MKFRQSPDRSFVACAAAVVLCGFLSLEARAEGLGENDALRAYMEFADGSNRGMYDPETGSKGYPDEAYDATTAMVINWHALPEDNAELDGRLRYRRVHPEASEWTEVQGESAPFWHRDELIHRVILTDLTPGSVYEFQAAEGGRVFRFRTMPASLDERPVRIALTADHQSPGWSDMAHANARNVASQQPDMFVVAGDFVNCEGEITETNAERWALYLDTLYGAENGYFIYDGAIGGQVFENLIIPHVGILGNHETGQRNHIRWPADPVTGMSEPGYPEFVAGNWMQLLFHWPFSSEGFYSEFRPEHPNINAEHVREGFGKGGYGALHFADYLLLIGLDNSQNWEGAPDTGLRDWEGNLITERWPWFETLHSDIRQDEWLRNLLEPEAGPTAGERFAHILPVWHRGLFGHVRLNMSVKNRGLMEYWLPILYRNGVRVIKEGHDHVYTRTVPMVITEEQPENTYAGKVHFEPMNWEITDNLSQDYIDDVFAADVLHCADTDAIVGWTYKGHYITQGASGMIAQGHGGWAAGRRDTGGRGSGNAGLWFVDEEQGGAAFGGSASFHTTTVILTNEDLILKTHRPDKEQPIHKARWDRELDRWQAFDFSAPDGGAWMPYEDYRAE